MSFHCTVPGLIRKLCCPREALLVTCKDKEEKTCHPSKLPSVIMSSCKACDHSRAQSSTGKHKIYRNHRTRRCFLKDNCYNFYIGKEMWKWYLAKTVCPPTCQKGAFYQKISWAARETLFTALGKSPSKYGVMRNTVAASQLCITECFSWKCAAWWQCS